MSLFGGQDAATNNISRLSELQSQRDSLYQTIINNQDQIAKDLSDFVVGYQIGEEVYDCGFGGKGPDVMLPNSESFQNVITEVNQDVSDIDKLITICENMQEEMRTLAPTDVLDQESTKTSEMLSEMKEKKDQRQDVLDSLLLTKQLIDENDNFFETIKNDDVDNTPADTGGSGGGVSPKKPTPTTNFELPIVPPVMTSNVASLDGIRSSVSAINSYEKQIGGILSHVILNEKVIGGDVYGVDSPLNAGDADFDFFALQLAIDYIKQDVTATQQLINQISQKITNNKNAIATKKAQQQEMVAVPDGKGGSVYIHKYDVAALQIEIDNLVAENEQLEIQKTFYTNRKKQKEGTYNDLMAVKNVYDRASSGLSAVFTANDALAALREGKDLSAYYGIRLTDSQQSDIFNYMKQTLEANQDYVKFVSGKSPNFAKGEFSLNQFNYMLESFAILGDKSSGSFQNNLNSWNEMNQAGKTGKYKNYVNPSKMYSNLSNIQRVVNISIAGIIQNTPPEIEEFLEENKGKTVQIPDSFKKKMNLKCDGIISIPKDYDPNQSYPFLYWLPGTEFASGEVSLLKDDPFVKNVAKGKYKDDNALIFIPCKFASGSTFASNSGFNTGMLDNDIEKLVTRLNVDTNRVSAAGTSIGAFATAYLTTSNPNLFSAVAMTGGAFDGSVKKSHLADGIENSPDTAFIWFNASNDSTSQAGLNLDGVNVYAYQQHQKLVDAGMTSIYYETGQIGHEAACARLGNENLVHDLTSIVKGQTNNDHPTGKIHVSSQESAYSGSDSWYIPLVK